MDVTAKQLMLDRAKALYRAAQLEAEQLGGGKGGSEGAGASTRTINRQLADARLAAAKADLDLASYWVDQGSPRTVFCGSLWRARRGGTGGPHG